MKVESIPTLEMTSKLISEKVLAKLALMHKNKDFFETFSKSNKSLEDSNIFYQNLYEMITKFIFANNLINCFDEIQSIKSLLKEPYKNRKGNEIIKVDESSSIIYLMIHSTNEEAVKANKSLLFKIKIYLLNYPFCKPKCE